MNAGGFKFTNVRLGYTSSRGVRERGGRRSLIALDHDGKLRFHLKPPKGRKGSWSLTDVAEVRHQTTRAFTIVNREGERLGAAFRSPEDASLAYVKIMRARHQARQAVIAKAFPPEPLAFVRLRLVIGDHQSAFDKGEIAVDAAGPEIQVRFVSSETGELVEFPAVPKPFLGAYYDRTGAVVVEIHPIAAIPRFELVVEFAGDSDADAFLKAVAVSNYASGLKPSDLKGLDLKGLDLTALFD